jgi:hypothetical protein
MATTHHAAIPPDATISQCDSTLQCPWHLSRVSQKDALDRRTAPHRIKNPRPKTRAGGLVARPGRGESVSRLQRRLPGTHHSRARSTTRTRVSSCALTQKQLEKPSATCMPFRRYETNTRESRRTSRNQLKNSVLQSATSQQRLTRLWRWTLFSGPVCLFCQSRDGTVGQVKEAGVAGFGRADRCRSACCKREHRPPLWR